jgi:alpha-amylase
MILQVVVFLSLLATLYGATPDEWRSRSIYQLLTDRFSLTSNGRNMDAPACDLHGYCGGKWTGIQSHLDYIQAMGFDSVWISPVVDNWPGGYHGYWQRKMHSANDEFGTWADLAALSSALHARGMFLMIDIVANHAWNSDDVSQNEPFNISSYYHDCSGCPSGCNVNDYTDHTQMEHCRLAGLMDFNNTDPEGAVANELLQWIQFVVAVTFADGLRIDTVPYVWPSFWTKFEAAAGVFCMGEVDTGDLSFAAPYQHSALSGILSYPLFFTLRNVFEQQQSMRQLGAQWRAGQSEWADTGLLGTFLSNHDNARFLNGQSDVTLFRAALAYSILSDGIPIVYYGDEFLFHGGEDPENREAFWENASFNASAAPLGSMMASLNELRRAKRLWEVPNAQLERWQDDNFYAFTKGDTLLAAFTNAGSHGQVQQRTVTFLPSSWPLGTKLCSPLDCSICATVSAGPALIVTIQPTQGFVLLDPSVTQC